MKIAYFSYLFAIKGVSAGSANKAIGFMDGLHQLGHETQIFWRGYQPPDDRREAYEKRQKYFLKKTLRKYLNEPKLLLTNAKHLIQEEKILRKFNPDVVISRLTLYQFSSPPSSPVESTAMTKAVQTQLDEGKSRFQIRLQFDKMYQYNQRADNLDIKNAKLIIKYK